MLMTPQFVFLADTFPMNCLNTSTLAHLKLNRYKNFWSFSLNSSSNDYSPIRKDRSIHPAAKLGIILDSPLNILHPSANPVLVLPKYIMNPNASHYLCCYNHHRLSLQTPNWPPCFHLCPHRDYSPNSSKSDTL